MQEAKAKRYLIRLMLDQIDGIVKTNYKKMYEKHILNIVEYYQIDALASIAVDLRNMLLLNDNDLQMAIDATIEKSEGIINGIEIQYKCTKSNTIFDLYVEDVVDEKVIKNYIYETVSVMIYKAIKAAKSINKIKEKAQFINTLQSVNLN